MSQWLSRTLSTARQSRRLRLILPALLLLGMAAYGSVWWSWDIPGIDQRVRSFARVHHIKIEGQSFRYSPLRGLILRKAHILLPLPHGAAMFLVPNGNLRLDPAHLSSDFRCNEIYVNQAVIHLFPGSATAPPKVPDYPDSDDLRLKEKRPRFVPKKVIIENSDLILRETFRAPVTLALKRLTVTLDQPRLSPFEKNPFKAIISPGKLEAQRLLFGSMEYSDVRGKFMLIDGNLYFDNLTLNNKSGNFYLSPSKFDLAADPPTIVAALTADLSDARSLGPALLPELKEQIAGKLRCNLWGELSDPNGDCRLTLAMDGLDVTRISFVREIGRLVFVHRRPIIAKGDWVIRFRVHDSAYEFRDAQLETNVLSFHLNGRVSENDMALMLDVLIPKPEIKEGTFPPQVIAELTDKNRIRFPFEILGELAVPQARVRRAKLSPQAFSEVKAFFRARAAAGRVFDDFLPQ